MTFELRIADRGSRIRRPLFSFLLSAFTVACYLLVVYLHNGEFGFPLDDAWIHQVFARNLGTRLEFAFFAGEPSAGSTSPLWVILLALGYALSIDYRVWTILLGLGLLGATAWRAAHAARFLTQDKRIAEIGIPLLLVLEWHLVWAAASGMEITLFIFLSVLVVELFWWGAPSLVLGAIAGLLTLTRPEGIVLGLVVAAGVAARTLQRSNVPTFQRSTLQLILFVLAFAIVLVPYLWFNLQTSGGLLPNTFYAKTQEYAELTRTNLAARLGAVYLQPLIGAPLLLVPGMIFCCGRLARERRWELLLPASWIVLLPALYAWRLPVVYQHGRYEMPILPFVVLYGVVGTAILLARMPMRVIRRAWALATAVLVVLFFGWGALLYAQDVAIINCEMIAMAKWTRAHLPPDARIAAHDIGAQGYFDEHKLLDLAGLVSPQVIPFIRDEERLVEWMRARGATYAIFFPTWYPRLARDARFVSVHTTDCELTRRLGEANLTLFALH